MYFPQRHLQFVIGSALFKLHRFLVGSPGFMPKDDERAKTAAPFNVYFEILH